MIDLINDLNITADYIKNDFRMLSLMEISQKMI
jgi:hypothetical protein